LGLGIERARRKKRVGIEEEKSIFCTKIVLFYVVMERVSAK